MGSCVIGLPSAGLVPYPVPHPASAPYATGSRAIGLADAASLGMGGKLLAFACTSERGAVVARAGELVPTVKATIRPVTADATAAVARTMPASRPRLIWAVPGTAGVETFI